MSADHKFYEDGHHWVSPFNFSSEATMGYALPNRVEFYDVTLRDGEQTPGIVFRKDEKLKIARALDEAGVQRIEGGMPVVSQEDMDALREIAHDGLKAKVMGFSRVLREDIDLCLKCDCSGIVCEAPVGVPKLKQFGWTYEQVIDKAVESIDYAKSHGLYTVFFGVDTLRAEKSFLMRLYSEISKGTKADALGIVDTFGCATPDAIRYLVGEIKKDVRLPLEIHVHNDFGLATATTFAAVLAGASVVHTAVNGIGERTGNASFEEVSTGLELLYGVKTGIDLTKLRRISKLVEELSRFPVPTNRPLVGERAFGRESGVSVAGWVKYGLGSEPVAPSVVGNQNKVVMGKKSGKHSITYKLNELGLSLPPEKVDILLERVKATSQKKKGEVTDTEFREMARGLS